MLLLLLRRGSKQWLGGEAAIHDMSAGEGPGGATVVEEVVSRG